MDDVQPLRPVAPLARQPERQFEPLQPLAAARQSGKLLILKFHHLVQGLNVLAREALLLGADLRLQLNCGCRHHKI